MLDDTQPVALPAGRKDPFGEYGVVFFRDQLLTPEQHLAGSFDMKLAPVARGFFVGDYEGLGSSLIAGAPSKVNFQPVFVTTVSTTNPSDVFTETAQTNAP